MSEFRVSVALATYNGELYLKEQLDSILTNLTDKDEIVISDDSSSDSTLKIIETYKSRFKNIKVLKGPCKGFAYNFENALKNCSGDYIFLCDQDDIWKNNKVDVCLNALKDYSVVCHNANILDMATNTIIGNTFNLKGKNDTIFNSIIKNSFIGCCMAFRKEVLSVAIPFSVNANIVLHDWIIGVSGLIIGKCLFLDEKLIDYRIHSNNAVGNMKTSFFYKIKKRIEQIKYYFVLKRRVKG